MKLRGKVAVITGGNSGIGLGTAQEFKAQGAEVAIFGRTQKTLEDAVQTIGNGTLAVQGDVTHLADLERLYQQTVERFGKIDVLVANAGVSKPVPVEQLDEAPVYPRAARKPNPGALSPWGGGPNRDQREATGVIST